MSSGESWLQWPTLAGGADVEVVGESRYQDALELVGGGRNLDGPRVRILTARLVCEPTNQFDPNAVVVEIESRKVAYIPREEAPRFSAALREFGAPATCRARLKGGFETRGERAHLGVVLDLAWPFRAMSTATEPFLPRGRNIAVVGEENSQASLAEIGEKSMVVATLVPTQQPQSPDPPFLMVKIGDRPVGMFSPAQTARYSRMVAAASAAGFPATCCAKIEQGKAKFEVILSLGSPYESDT